MVTTTLTGSMYRMPTTNGRGWEDPSTGQTFTSSGSEIAFTAGDYFFLHWNNVDIYPGSTINSAYVRTSWYQKTATDPGTEYPRFHLHKHPDSPALVTGAVESSRALTTAYVDQTITWNTAGATYQHFNSPDFKAAVQEVVDDPQWARLNRMMLIIKAMQEGSALTFVLPGGFMSSGETRLVIDWTPPAGVASGPPVVTSVQTADAPYEPHYNRAAAILGAPVQDPDTQPYVDGDPLLYYLYRSRPVGGDWPMSDDLAGNPTIETWQSVSNFNTPVSLGSFMSAPGEYDLEVKAIDLTEQVGPVSSKIVRIVPQPEAPTGVGLAGSSAEKGADVAVNWTHQEPVASGPQTGVQFLWRAPL